MVHGAVGFFIAAGLFIVARSEYASIYHHLIYVIRCLNDFRKSLNRKSLNDLGLAKITVRDHHGHIDF